MSHLGQPNKIITLGLPFESFDISKKTGKIKYHREWTHYYTFELEPVVYSNGQNGWRKVEPVTDDDFQSQQWFDKWCEENKINLGRNIHLMEALQVFGEDAYWLGIDNTDTNWGKNILKRMKISDTIDVQKAKNYPIELLIQNYGYQIKQNKINCPFHGEDRNPSLQIYPRTNSWYCYACNAGSDTIDFVMKHQKIDFVEAVKHLN